MFDASGLISKLRVMFMALSLAMPASWAGAADIRWVATEAADGFSVMMPTIDVEVLLDEMASRKSALQQTKLQLSREVREQRMTGGDTLLSLLLPGGLFYAAYKKNVHAKTVQKHEQLAARLNELSSDLVTLSATNAPIALARKDD